MSISDEKYVSLVTYTKDGREKPAPVWIVDLGTNDAGQSQVGFTTSGESWKAKRIRNTPAVTLQPSDQRGAVTPGTEIVSGTAEIITGPQFDEVKTKVKAKYGFMVSIISAMNAVRKVLGKGGPSDSAVVITLT
ncbi:MAG: PPOX class F420-dependent oxidoreductase [Acidimicrobiales bacterium]